MYFNNTLCTGIAKLVHTVQLTKKQIGTRHKKLQPMQKLVIYIGFTYIYYTQITAKVGFLTSIEKTSREDALTYFANRNEPFRHQYKIFSKGEILT